MIGDDCYVYIDFVKPSKCTEEVNVNNGDNQYFFFPAIRKEEIRFVGIENIRKKDEIVDVPVNVFEEWKVDSDETHAEMLKNDFKDWKLGQVIEDPEDLKQVQDIIYRNIGQLKQIYATLISTSQYPYIGWLDFGNYSKRTQTIDENTKIAAIDRIFIAST